MKKITFLAIIFALGFAFWAVSSKAEAAEVSEIDPQTAANLNAQLEAMKAILLNLREYASMKQVSNEPFESIAQSADYTSTAELKQENLAVLEQELAALKLIVLNAGIQIAGNQLSEDEKNSLSASLAGIAGSLTAMSSSLQTFDIAAASSAEIPSAVVLEQTPEAQNVAVAAAPNAAPVEENQPQAGSAGSPQAEVSDNLVPLIEETESQGLAAAGSNVSNSEWWIGAVLAVFIVILGVWFWKKRAKDEIKGNAQVMKTGNFQQESAS